MAQIEEIRCLESALDVLVNWAMKNAVLISPSFGGQRPCVFHRPAY
jgi:hypothetical protein